MAHAGSTDSGHIAWANLDVDGPQLIQPWLPTQVDDGGNVYAMGFFGMFKVNADGTSAWAFNGGNYMGFSVATDRSVFTVGGTTAPGGGWSDGAVGGPRPGGESVSYRPGGVVPRDGDQCGSIDGDRRGGHRILDRDDVVLGRDARGGRHRDLHAHRVDHGRRIGTGAHSVWPAWNRTRNPSNDSFAVVVTVAPVVQSADLSVTMSDAPDPARRNRSMVYTIVAGRTAAPMLPAASRSSMRCRAASFSWGHRARAGPAPARAR